MFNKIVSFVLCCCVILSGSILNVRAETAEELTLGSPSAIVMEAESGTVIYEKNADAKMKPASVTKVMTLLLVFQAIENKQYTLEDIVTVSEHAASMGGSQCFFEANEQQTVEDMIKCIIIASGNDAAVAMAEFTSGSEEAFVADMNNKARELGMENTTFKNACGLDADGHETTARDIAIMSRELITRYPDIFNYTSIWTDTIIHKTRRGEKEFGLVNTNKFLRQYQGATGLKTGYTSTAHYCISATANRNGVKLIAVVMGADTKENRNTDAAKLLDYGFARCYAYTDKKILQKNDIKVLNGDREYVKITSVSDFNAVLLNGEKAEDVKKELVLYDDELKAPLKKRDCIGYVKYTVGDRTIGMVAVNTGEAVGEKTYMYGMQTMFEHIIRK